MMHKYTPIQLKQLASNTADLIKDIDTKERFTFYGMVAEALRSKGQYYQASHFDLIKERELNP